MDLYEEVRQELREFEELNREFDKRITEGELRLAYKAGFSAGLAEAGNILWKEDEEDED